MVLLGVHPDESSVPWPPLARKFVREVQENRNCRVWTQRPSSPLPPHPSLCTGTGLWRPKRGAGFICKRWCLHFRPSSGGVQQGCKGRECSLITNRVLWSLNGSPKPRRLMMLGSAELPLQWGGVAFWWESLQLSVSCIYGVCKDYLQIILRVFSQPYALFQR